jgi:dTDP-4-dehydrorhamnose 3,5-epimerase
MNISSLALAGVHLIELTPQSDERGFFARMFCEKEFAAAGLNAQIPQINLSFNARRGTLRGMHFQRAPHGETKVVRCIRGAIYDVVVDLRQGSSAWGKWLGVELNAENRNALYIPAGFAHGFQTLADETEVLYFMGSAFVAEASAGIRFDDPMLGISWPLNVSVISAKDLGYEALNRGVEA